MPIKHCKKDGKSGFKWGNSAKCWTYTAGDKASMMAAKKACIRQAIAIAGPQKFKEEVSHNSSLTAQESDEIYELLGNWPETIEDYKELIKLKEELENTDCGCSQ